MSYFEQQSYPDIEPDADMLCPNCKAPEWGAYVWEMETDYDADESGVHRNDYVTAWKCDNCDHVFSEDDALSIEGCIEDDETDSVLRDRLLKWKNRED